MKAIFLIMVVVVCVYAACAVPVADQDQDADVAAALKELQDTRPQVSFSILGKVARWVPWGTVIDLTVEGVKKVKEMVSN